MGRGSLFRCRRADGLQVNAQQVVDLVPGLTPIALLKAEDGDREPPGGWARLDAALDRLLEDRVREHLATGATWDELRLPGWTADEIRAAAEVSRD